MDSQELGAEESGEGIPLTGPSPTRGEGRADKDKSIAAAERIIEALKDPLKDYLPDFDEQTKAAIIAIMKTRGYGWRFLRRRVREDHREYDVIKSEIIEAYGK